MSNVNFNLIDLCLLVHLNIPDVGIKGLRKKLIKLKRRVDPRLAHGHVELLINSKTPIQYVDDLLDELRLINDALVDADESIDAIGRVTVLNGRKVRYEYTQLKADLVDGGIDNCEACERHVARTLAVALLSQLDGVTGEVEVTLLKSKGWSGKEYRLRLEKGYQS